MTVATRTQPDFTQQSGAVYKSAIDAAARVDGRISGAFAAHEQPAPNMTVLIDAGAIPQWLSVPVEVAAQSTGTFTAPVSNSRKDIVYIDAKTGAVGVATGTPGASPSDPAIPDGKVAVARVTLTSSSTVITNSMIDDLRIMQFLGMGTAAGYDVGAGADQIPTNADISTGQETVTAGEDLADRDAIYCDVANQRGGGAGKWYKVDTDATSPVRLSRVRGVALSSITSGNTGLAQVGPGVVTGLSGLTSGQAIYASGTAGAMTQTEPAVPSSGTQNAAVIMGRALSATTMQFEPWHDVTFQARNSALSNGASITVEHWTDGGARERVAMAYITASGGYGSDLITGSETYSADQGTAANAADGDTATQVGNSTDRAAPWWQVQFPTARCLTKYRAYLKSSGPYVSYIQSITIKGSNTGAFSGEEVTIDTWSNPGAFSADAWNERTFSNASSYTYYRWVFINSPNGEQRLAEMEAFESTAARDEPLSIGSEAVNSTATDRVTIKFSDSADANQDTKTTFTNRTSATRNMIAEVTL